MLSSTGERETSDVHHVSENHGLQTAYWSLTDATWRADVPSCSAH